MIHRSDAPLDGTLPVRFEGVPRLRGHQASRGRQMVLTVLTNAAFLCQSRICHALKMEIKQPGIRNSDTLAAPHDGRIQYRTVLSHFPMTSF